MAATGSEIANAFVAITVRAPGVKKDIEKELGGADTSKVGAGLGSKLADGMKKTLKVAGVGVAAVLGTALVKGFGRLKAIETAQAKMRGLGYDADTVATAMDNALASVKGTAFGLGDAATVAGAAMAAQIKPGKELETHLTRIANNAAAAGTTFDEMGSIFNKAATQANGVQNDIIGQLADKGIPIYAELGEQMGVTAGEVFKLASEGKINFETFSKAAEAAAGTVADEMGNTTTGAFDNMLAALGRLGAKILEDIFPLIGPLFKEITAGLDNAITHVEPVVSWIGERLPGAIQRTRDVFSGLFSWVNSNKDWLAPVLIAVGSFAAITKGARIATGLWQGSIAAVKAVQAAYTAYTYGMAGATYTYEGASKAGAIATKLFNAALRANPLGIIITAIVALVAGLVWFFTQTETGKKAWAEFTRFLGEAWENIKGFFVAAYENVILPVFEGIKTAIKAVGDFFVAAWEGYIKPVFDGIAAVATWVFENILLPLFDLVVFGFAIMAGIFQGIWDFILRPVFDALAAIVVWLYESVIKPIFDLIGAVFEWLYNNVIVPVIDGIKLYIDAWATVIQWLWNNAIKPAIDAIGKAFKWIYDSIIKPVVDLIKLAIDGAGIVFKWLWENAVKPALDGISTAMSWLYNTIIKPVWDGIKNTISNVWNNGIKPVIDTLVKVIRDDPKKAFEAARDGIGKAWTGIQDLAKKPVRFVIETVINGLINTINKIPGVNLKKVPLPKGFYDGGYTGNLAPTAVAGVVHGDEHVIRAASRRRIEASHPGLLDHLNRTGTVPGYKRGGWVDPLPAGSFSVSQPFGRAQSFGGYHNGIDLAAPLGTKILAPRKGVAQTFYDSLGGNMVSLAHDNGYVTRYAHLGSYGVKSGQSVNRGETLGRIGMTGLTTGPHLHYMMSQPPGGWGDVVNPAGFMGGKNSEKAGLFDLLGGLTGWAADKFKAAFPGSDIWVDAAGGLMKQAVESVVDWGKSKLGMDVGGVSKHAPTLYDRGGWLDPGTHLVQNKTRRPEPILTGSQWDSMSRLAEGGGMPRSVKLVVRDREFDAFLEEIADDRVEASLGGLSRGSMRRDGGF